MKPVEEKIFDSARILKRKKSKFKISLKKIQEELANTQRQFLLGPSNIAPIARKNKSCDNDSIRVNRFVFFRKEQQRNVSALIDNDLDQLTSKRIGEFNQDYMDNYSSLSQIEDAELEKKMILNAIAASRDTMSGNCGSMSSYLSWALYAHQGIESEVVEFDQLDHACVVIGRNKKTNVNDSRTWNKDVIIVDPWLNLCFTLTEFHDFWRKNINLINQSTSINPEHMGGLTPLFFKKLREQLILKPDIYAMRKESDSSIFHDAKELPISSFAFNKS